VREEKEKEEEGKEKEKEKEHTDRFCRIRNHLRCSFAETTN
jgi:hypothetical protein